MLGLLEMPSHEQLSNLFLLLLLFFSRIEILSEMESSRLLLMLNMMEDSTVASQPCSKASSLPLSLALWI